MLKTMLPDLTDAITQDSTAEEAAAFLANCMGEAIAVEYYLEGQERNGFDGSCTFLVKLLSVSFKRYAKSADYVIALRVDGRDQMTINSQRAFNIKKCASTAGHIF